jgi:glycosyltransferase A (GT-A) superfamily protein (DUF2064 family)
LTEGSQRDPIEGPGREPTEGPRRERIEPASRAAAVLIMACAPRPGEVRRALEPQLGREGCAALQRELIVQTACWARRVAPEAVFVAHHPPDCAAELRELVGDGVVLFPQNGRGISGRLGDAVARVFARVAAPLLVVWPDLAQLRDGHARAALEDLRSGADLVLGPAYGGGFYLVGMRRALPQLLSVPEGWWRSGDALALGLAAGAREGLCLGLLRAERALHRPDDLRALAADPTLPPSLARILSQAGLGSWGARTRT